jgi:hypothetical protein
VIKSRRMRQVGHAARMGERTGGYRILVGNLKEDLGIDAFLQEVGWKTGLD